MVWYAEYNYVSLYVSLIDPRFFKVLKALRLPIVELLESPLIQNGYQTMPVLINVGLVCQNKETFMWLKVQKDRSLNTIL
jgi:hypothetical protein